MLLLLPPSLRTQDMTKLRGRSLSGDRSLGGWSVLIELDGPAMGDGSGDVTRLDWLGAFRPVSVLLLLDGPAPGDDEFHIDHGSKFPAGALPLLLLLLGLDWMSFVDLFLLISCLERRFFSRTEPDASCLSLPAPVSLSLSLCVSLSLSRSRLATWT